MTFIQVPRRPAHLRHIRFEQREVHLKVLIVFARHEPKSFNTPLLTRSVAAEGKHLHMVNTAEPLTFQPLADFRSDWRFKPCIASKTVGQIR